MYALRIALVALVLAALVAGCAPSSATAPTPTLGGPGSSDSVPTPDVPTLSAADIAATAQAAATSTPVVAADIATATAFAGAAGPTPTALASGPSGAAVAFTPVAEATAVLPAPIYVRSQNLGQVLRIERDALSYRQLTFEQQSVVEMAAPSAAGGLVYLIGDPVGGERVLVTLDGTGRRELLRGALSDLVVMPDGSQFFMRLSAPEPGVIMGMDQAEPGVWTTSSFGGRPVLLIADEPADGVVDPDRPAWTYRPMAVSPDGSTLAVFASDQDGPALPGGELVLLDLEGKRGPVRAPICCEASTWAADGASLLTAGGGPAPDTSYGLLRSDLTGGQPAQILDVGDGAVVPLVTGPYQPAGGQVLAFVELVPAEGFNWESPFRPTLARIGPGGQITPLTPALDAPGEVLWMANGSGALVTQPGLDPERAGLLAWVSADSGVMVPIPFDGTDMAWVPANRPLEAGDCSAFVPLRYPAGRMGPGNPNVADLQSRLLAGGFDGGLPDGLYGPQTRAGVSAFQQARGLPVTGDVDCATWQAVLGQGG